MILRKPYAILIKNFKLIHLIISVFLCYLVYKTSAISTFFTNYIVSPTVLIDPSKVHTLTHILIYILPFLVIIGSVVIMILMRFKKKPITFYFLTIIVSILSIIYYTYASSILTTLEINLVDVRTLKLCQDFSRTLLAIQFITTIITIVRATGFNIKKFNFSKDLEELDIEEKDREEFEVNVEVDADKYKRWFRRFKRYAKYIFIENKYLLLLGFVILAVGTGSFIYLNVTVFHKVYKIGDIVDTSDVSLIVKDVYTTEFDVKGIEEENYSYVLVPFTVSSLSTNAEKLETAKFYLSVAGRNFYHESKFNDSFYDLGKGYNNENLSSTASDFLFIFRIPTTFLKEKMYMVYNEGTKKYTYKVKANKLDKEDTVKETKMANSMNLEDSILKKTSFKIDSYEIGSSFKEVYTYCPEPTDCALSGEYILPTYSGRENKVLLKIKGTYQKDEKVELEDLETLRDFVQKFGIIEYSDDKGIYRVSSPLSFVKPNKAKIENTYYIECPSSIEHANSIWISFYIRGKQYKYILK